MAAFDSRRAVATMSPSERATELQLWSGPVEIPFRQIHRRIEELVGRPVWTHEMAGRQGFGALENEIMAGEPATMGDIVAKVPSEKLIVVELSEAAS